jgi:hypothetical protein
LNLTEVVLSISHVSEEKKFISVHFCSFHFFASLRGRHSHDIGLHRIGSISFASPIFVARPQGIKG